LAGRSRRFGGWIFATTIKALPNRKIERKSMLFGGVQYISKVQSGLCEALTEDKTNRNGLNRYEKRPKNSSMQSKEYVGQSREWRIKGSGFIPPGIACSRLMKSPKKDLTDAINLFKWPFTSSKGPWIQASVCGWNGGGSISISDEWCRSGKIWKKSVGLILWSRPTRAMDKFVFHLRPDQIPIWTAFAIVSRVEFLEEVRWPNCIKSPTKGGGNEHGRDMPGAFRKARDFLEARDRWYQKTDSQSTGSAGLASTPSLTLAFP